VWSENRSLVRFAVLAIYADQRSELLIEASSLREGCALAMRIANDFGRPEVLGRPEWIRVTADDEMIVEISVDRGMAP
jgi:hypothetical protein